MPQLRALRKSWRTWVTGSPARHVRRYLYVCNRFMPGLMHLHYRLQMAHAYAAHLRKRNVYQLPFRQLLHKRRKHSARARRYAACCHANYSPMGSKDTTTSKQRRQCYNA